MSDSGIVKDESTMDDSNTMASTSHDEMNSSQEAIAKQDSDTSLEDDETKKKTANAGHDNKGFFFGEDPLDPNNETNQRLRNSNRNLNRRPEHHPSDQPPPYRPSVSDKEIDVYDVPKSSADPHHSKSPTSEGVGPHQFDSHHTANHQFDSHHTVNHEPSLRNNNDVSTISNGVSMGSVTGPSHVDPSHVDPTLHEDHNNGGAIIHEDHNGGAIPYPMTKKPQKSTFCATLALFCLIFLFIFLFLAVGVFAAVYFTVLFPVFTSPSDRDDVSTTIRPSSPGPSYPDIDEIYVSVILTLNQSFQPSYNDIMSDEYKTLELSIVSAMNNTFTNSELMDVYVRTDVENVRPGSIIVNSTVRLTDVPEGSLPSDSSSGTGSSPIEQIQSVIQMLVLDTLQTGAETNGSPLMSINVESNSIIVDTPVVIIALTTTPKLTTTILPTTTQSPTTNVQTTTSVITSRQPSTNLPSTQPTTTVQPTDTVQPTTVQPTTAESDLEPPEVSCPSDIGDFTDPGEPTAIVSWSPATATDNSGSVASLVSDYSSNSAFDIGVTTVTYTATDAAGNVATCSFQITVIDKEPPLLLCPATVRVPTNPGENFTTGVTWDKIFATDNSRSVSTAVGDHDENNVFPLGSTIVTYTASDPSGNVGECSFFVIVEDKEGPQLTCPDDITQPADQDTITTSVTWDDPSIDDNLMGEVTLQSNYISGSTFSLGQTVVDYTAVDEAGNTGQCSFVITVTDTQPPLVTCPTDLSADNDPGLGTADASWQPATATDNTGVNPVPVSDYASGSSFPIGTTVVTYSAMDTAGNTGTCRFAVTVLDVEAPTLTCPSPVTAPNDPGLGTAAVTWLEPTVSDNSQSIIDVVPSTANGSSFLIGVSTVRYTATDESGNWEQCTFEITVQDVEPPVINCPVNQTSPADPGLVTAVVTWPKVMATDNSQTNPFNAGGTHQSGSRYPIGVTEVTYFAADLSSNLASCSFLVIVEDIEDPQVTCPDDIQAYVVVGSSNTTVSWALPNVTDNADIEGDVTCDATSGTEFLLGAYVVECGAVDIHGNMGSCQFSITVSEPTVQISGSLTIDDTFTPSLMDPNSDDFKILEQKVINSMDAVFSSGNESKSYGASSVVGFRSGSVVADLRIAFGRTVEQDDLQLFVADEINRAVIDGTINEVDVVPDSAQFNEAPVVPIPATALRFDCDERETTNPSQAVVSIQLRTSHGCSGVLITQRHVLTAASCIGIGGTLERVLLGSRTLSGQEVTAEEVDINRVYQHPGFNALTGDNDLAVLELQRALPTDLFQPSCLEYHALGSLQLDDYQDCFIAGWGTLMNTQFTTLQTSTVGTLSNDVGSECDSYTQPFTMTKTKMCATEPGGPHDMCTADTGSPLMCKNQNDGWTLVGLSNGLVFDGCDIGTYTHVSEHWQFISSVVDNAVISVPCDPIEVSSCAASLPYISTFTTTQSSYEGTMQQLNSILSCHVNAELFFCSSFIPECALSRGLVPCQGLCEEVEQSCYGPYEVLFGEGSWAFYCTDFPASAEGDKLLCEKGTNPTCGETSLQVSTEQPLILTSPNYPGNYPDIQECIWFIEGPADSTLVAKFKDLGIEECCDTLTIGSGSDPLDRTSIVKQLYGTEVENGFEEIMATKMWVRFQSDYSENLQGFHLEVYAVEAIADFCQEPDAFDCAGDTALCVPSTWRCDQVNDCPGNDDEGACPEIERMYLSGLDSSTILSPGYPIGYYGDTNQIWVVSAEPQNQIHLMFMTFETEKDFDFVNVGQGDNPFASDSIFFAWSGDRIPPPMRSSGNSMWIQLTSDTNIFKDGFELVVTSVMATEPIECLVDEHFDCGSGVCITSGWQCDNVTDCIYARDEYGCYGQVTCSPDEFQCGDGLCIALGLICDGAMDCGDQSDERGCPTTQPPVQSMGPTLPPQPDCDSNPCENGATCEDVADTFLCLCAPGYQGMMCDQEINECMPNPCKNRGVCTDGLDSYSCECVEGFNGDNCEIDIDDCVGMPCMSGSICIDGVNSFECDCPLGYQGDLCDIAPCDPIESETCLALLPYNTTVLPNPNADSQQDALETLANLASIQDCHPNANLLHCSALYPQCPWPDYTKTSTPCRSVCVEVTSACAELYEETYNEAWPYDCDTYVAGEGTFCDKAEGDIFGTGLCGTRPEASVNSRIVGGSDAAHGAWPWIGSLWDSYGVHQCGGTLLNERWVLTAAHCVGNFHSVVFGDTELYSDKPAESRKEYRFLKIVSHPMYDQTMVDEENDIAMMLLPERVNYTGFLRPSCLATNEDETLAYRDCYVVGWGSRMEDGETSERLQEVSIPLISPDGCRAKLGSRVISDNMICAGLPQGGIDSCQGDSGGPLACLGNDDVWHLVGVTSFGYGCARPNSPGVYARVSQYMDFIQDTIKETEDSVQEITLQLNQTITITSPDFPAFYPNDAYKEWSITSPPGTHIVLTVISHNSEINYDYVRFGEGHDSANLDSLILVLQNKIDGQPLYSTIGNKMWMYFVSDYSVTLEGFEYNLTAANPDDFATCGNGPQVIPPHWVCDGYEDCPGSTDEEGCPQG